ncbi:hypothetical protein E2C01_074188 [Portunus trituberculatus]|uniref:Uncharacterized protein n=1 Tax=Portunus trituberculatus TaxID=210409 RepID=A0A5B7I2R2_PORTR|nr:hypothetical protein [Portunus trituberculatus]
MAPGGIFQVGVPRGGASRSNCEGLSLGSDQLRPLVSHVVRQPGRWTTEEVNAKAVKATLSSQESSSVAYIGCCLANSLKTSRKTDSMGCDRTVKGTFTASRRGPRQIRNFNSI